MPYSTNPENTKQSDNYNAAASNYSLQDCESEPIHIPGSIQPHGFLIGFSEDQTILCLSKNLEVIFNKPVQDFLGKPLLDLMGEAAVSEIARNAGLIKKKVGKKKFFKLDLFNQDGEHHTFELMLHWNQELFLLEFESVSDKEPALEEQDYLDYINESMSQIREADSPRTLAEVIARKLKELSLFHRVMVYRFHEDGSGEVIAEEKEENLDPYLGLHYPATDIPQQARILYQLNPIRIIPDVNYTPATLISGENERPVDLSFANLRSVSPIHVQYLKNMWVAASMSVSIIKDHKLWGLLAFHHQQPYNISYQHTQLCLLLSNAFSLVLREKEEEEIQGYKDYIQEVQATLFRQMSRAENFTDGLYKQEINVQNLISSGGCVLVLGSEIRSIGEVPTMDQVRELVIWLQKNIQDDLFCTNKLPEVYAAAKDFRKCGSGILAVSISHVQQEYIIWFRPEMVQTIKWAGVKEKGLDGPGQEMELSPRKSFEAWSELLRNRSREWLPVEIEAAKGLRGFIVDMVLRISGELKLRADILSRINHQLGSDKNELDSFAYVISHDLKEPLRGIQQYASFILEDYASVLDSPGQAKLQTLVRLGKRMQQLIDSLLHFSRLGRFELQLEKISLEEIVGEVLDIFKPQVWNENIKIEVEPGLPVIFCDTLRVGEVFTNLISNGLKYNSRETKEIQIGYRKAMNKELSPSGYVFFVKDNGIGIDPGSYKEVFEIFRRLHGRDQFGGGTGAGLTISKRIVERHGGQMWVESRPGFGSTFYFSL